MIQIRNDNLQHTKKQLGFYFDQSRCTGCYACAIACRDWHDVQDTTVHWRRISAFEWGRYPEVRVAYLSLSCVHCAQPACMASCPVSAITKRSQDGIVLVDQHQCLGGSVCGSCRKACPYGVPQFSSSGDERMQKCTLCVERIDAGQQPVCVEACPVYALDWGPVDELQKKYGGVPEVRGFSIAPGTAPSIVFKPRWHEGEE